MGRFAQVAAACAAVLLIGCGVAYATGSLPFVGSDGTITACVLRSNGQLRLAGTSVRKCNSHTEQTVTWNQQGVQGDPGVDGRSIVATAADCNGDGGFSLAYDDGTPIGTLCNGAAGAKGDAGNLVGSACQLPDSTAGTVAETVAVDGTITFTCHTETQGGGGTPQAEICNGVDDDLDGVIDDNLTDTPAGTYANGFMQCEGRNGWALECDAGYGDADGQAADGCEVDLETDPHNCGFVHNDITQLPHVAAIACVNGQPVIQACAQGYEDLDNNPNDGCEYGPTGTAPPKSAPSRHDSQRPV